MHSNLIRKWALIVLVVLIITSPVTKIRAVEPFTTVVVGTLVVGLPVLGGVMYGAEGVRGMLVQGDTEAGHGVTPPLVVAGGGRLSNIEFTPYNPGLDSFSVESDPLRNISRPETDNGQGRWYHPSSNDSQPTSPLPPEFESVPPVPPRGSGAGDEEMRGFTPSQPGSSRSSSPKEEPVKPATTRGSGADGERSFTPSQSGGWWSSSPKEEPVKPATTRGSGADGERSFTPSQSGNWWPFSTKVEPVKPATTRGSGADGERSFTPSQSGSWWPFSPKVESVQPTATRGSGADDEARSFTPSKPGSRWSSSPEVEYGRPTATRGSVTDDKAQGFTPSQPGQWTSSPVIETVPGTPTRGSGSERGDTGEPGGASSQPGSSEAPSSVASSPTDDGAARRFTPSQPRSWWQLWSSSPTAESVPLTATRGSGSQRGDSGEHGGTYRQAGSSEASSSEKQPVAPTPPASSQDSRPAKESGTAQSSTSSQPASRWYWPWSSATQAKTETPSPTPGEGSATESSEKRSFTPSKPGSWWSSTPQVETVSPTPTRGGSDDGETRRFTPSKPRSWWSSTPQVEAVPPTLTRGGDSEVVSEEAQKDIEPTVDASEQEKKEAPAAEAASNKEKEAALIGPRLEDGSFYSKPTAGKIDEEKGSENGKGKEEDKGGGKEQGEAGKKDKVTGQEQSEKSVVEEERKEPVAPKVKVSEPHTGKVEQPSAGSAESKPSSRQEAGGSPMASEEPPEDEASTDIIVEPETERKPDVPSTPEPEDEPVAIVDSRKQESVEEQDEDGGSEQEQDTPPETLPEIAPDTSQTFTLDRSAKSTLTYGQSVSKASGLLSMNSFHSMRNLMAFYRTGYLFDFGTASLDDLSTTELLADSGNSAKPPIDQNRFQRSAGEWHSFVQVNGIQGDHDRSGHLQALSYKGYGLNTGVFREMSDRLVSGFMFGTQRVSVNYSRSPGSATENSLRLGPFLSWSNHDWRLDAALTFSHSEYHLKRHDALQNSLKADFTGTGLNGYLALGYDFHLDHWLQGLTLTPLAEVLYIHHDNNGFREKGSGPLTLKAGGQSCDQAISRLGIETGYVLPDLEHPTMLNVSLGWQQQHQSGASSHWQLPTLAAMGRFDAPSTTDSGAFIGIHFNRRLSEHGSTSFSYTGTRLGKGVSHGLQLEYQLKF